MAKKVQLDVRTIPCGHFCLPLNVPAQFLVKGEVTPSIHSLSLNKLRKKAGMSRRQLNLVVYCSKKGLVGCSKNQS